MLADALLRMSLSLVIGLAGFLGTRLFFFAFYRDRQSSGLSICAMVGLSFFLFSAAVLSQYLVYNDVYIYLSVICYALSALLFIAAVICLINFGARHER